MPTSHAITGFQRGSSSPACRACTTPSGWRRSTSGRLDVATALDRFRSVYGSNPLHLLTLIAGFALFGYVLATIKPATVWNPHTWWQSIAVWFAAAIIAHDLVLFPLY